MDASDQQSSKTTALKADSSIGTCRLRNGLNDDCLLKIMEFLNIYDLKQLSDTDTYYKDLITKWIVGKRLFNLTRITLTSDVEIFEEFGKSMKKIVICEPDFQNFLHTITKWCAPDTLTDVELNIDSRTWENQLTTSTAVDRLPIPILSNLRKFKLNMRQQNSTFDTFLNSLLVSATNLTHLHLFNVDMKGQWLEQTKTLNLHELRIIESCVDSIARLEILLSCSPKLRKFMYKGYPDITAVGPTLLEKCPNLEVFVDIHKGIRHPPETRYNFLASFANLHTVTLSSYTYCGCDLYYALTELSHRNILHLKIFAYLQGAKTFNKAERKRIMQNCSFSHFVSVSSLDLKILNAGSDGAIHCEFLLLFATQLKNLEKFTLQNGGRLADLGKIIEPLLPQVRTLSISKVILKRLPVEMRKIVRTLRAIRQVSDMFENRVVLQLIVSIEQWRELQVYKDIDKLIKTVIDHQARRTVMS